MEQTHLTTLGSDGAARSRSDDRTPEGHEGPPPPSSMRRAHLVLGAIALGAIVATAVAIKTATWAGAVGFDGWAYTMWGESLARGEMLAFKGQTIPKPLAITLSLLMSWLPGQWGPVVIMSAAVGAVAAGLLWAGTRLRGPLAGGAAVIALFVSTTFDSLYEISDGVSAACVVWGVATRGRLRIVFFVLAGLLRPEAWPLALVVGYTESAGMPRRRRVVASIAWGLAAPVSWMAFDGILAGDPLAGVHWLQAARVERAGGGTAPLVPKTIGDVMTTLGDVLATDAASVIVLVAGIAGLILLGRRRLRRPGGVDVYALIVFITGTVTLIAFFVVVAELYERYMLPFTLTMLALGTGYLVASIFRRSVPVLPVVAVCALLLVAGTWRLDLAPLRARTVAVTEKTEDTVEMVRRVSHCGRIAVSGNWRARSYIPFLAVLSDMSAERFVVNNDPDGEPLEPGPHVGAIIKLHHGHGGVMPDWPKVRTPLGSMAIRPGCDVGPVQALARDPRIW